MSCLNEELNAKVSILIDKIVENILYFINISNLSLLDINKHISIYKNEIEFNSLLNSTRLIFCEIFSQLIDNLDETSIIKYYKNIYKTKGIQLITHKKSTRTFLCSNGPISFSRYILRPKTKIDAELLKNSEGKTAVIPKDEWLRLADLPYKMTVGAMLDIAEWTTIQLSYHAASDAILKGMKVNITHETARVVTNTIGEIIYNLDVTRAEETFKALMDAKLDSFHEEKDYVLYLQVDGAMLHVRKKGEAARWAENKLGVIFSSDNMIPKEISNGEMHYEITKREYLSYLCSVDLFQKLLFHTAIKNGYGLYKKTVLISDGATWIRNMKDYLFPNAIQILDLWHLCQHLYEFAKIYYNNDLTKTKTWVDIIKEKFRNSNYKEALIEIETKENKLTKKYKNRVTNDGKNIKLTQYIQNNIKNIDYKEYRKQGLYIGSGHIESGNKSVAQERLKRPGMTWSEENAQHLLTLRAKYKSNLWGKEVALPILKHYKMI
jgi:hypothetical protein